MTHGKSSGHTHDQPDGPALRNGSGLHRPVVADQPMIQQTLWTAVASLVGILAVIGLGARLYKSGFLRRIQNPNGRTVILLTGGSQDVVVGWMPET